MTGRVTRSRHGRLSLPATIATVAALTINALSASADHDLFRHISVGEINGNGSDGAQFGGASDDGTHVVFQTDEQLVPGDTDTFDDVYERFAGSTRLVSAGQINGNGDFNASFEATSTDGSRIFFNTDEQLVTADTDSSIDIYRRSAGMTTLISRGTINGNDPYDAGFSLASDDGTIVFFRTEEQLVAGDTDGSPDIYRRAGGVTIRISVGQVNGNGAFSSTLRHITADGSRAFFETNEKLVPGDTDGTDYSDVYERVGNTTRNLSRGPAGANGPFDASFDGASEDGSRVFFKTRESLVAGDTDGEDDVYQRFGNSTTWLSRGPAGGNAAEGAFFVGSSADGRRVLFETAEPLVTADTDSEIDVYLRRNGVTSLVSVGQVNGNGPFFSAFTGASRNGRVVFFYTSEPLVSGDLDAEADIYQRSGGVTTLVSAGAINGNGAHGADFGWASTDGQRVLFSTFEKLALGDTDDELDIYERTAGATTLVSIGDANSRADLVGATPDCRWAYFVTEEQILANDKDSVHDVYGAYDP